MTERDTMREEALERLDAEMSLRAYDLLTPEAIESLAQLRVDKGVFVSLYLDMTPQRLQEAQLPVRVKRLLREAYDALEAEDTPKETLKAAKETFDRIQTFFEEEFDLTGHHGKGLVLFAAPAMDIWNIYRLPVPVRDMVYVGDRPQVRTLVRIAEEFEPTGVIFVDRRHGRLFRVFMGDIDEWAEERDDDVPGWHDQGGWSQARYQRHIEDHIERHFKKVAEDARRFFEQAPITRLILAGQSENTKAFEEFLPNDLRQKVVAHIPMEHFAGLRDILERVLEVEQQIERQVEAERFQKLQDAYHTGKGVMGLDETLQALNEKRVMVLLVAEGFIAPGAECTQCGWLTSKADLATCELCGGAMLRTDDVVELAIERAVEQADDIDVIRGELREKMLQEAGGIGAILRY